MWRAAAEAAEEKSGGEWRRRCRHAEAMDAETRQVAEEKRAAERRGEATSAPTLPTATGLRAAFAWLRGRR